MDEDEEEQLKNEKKLQDSNFTYYCIRAHELTEKIVDQIYGLEESVWKLGTFKIILKAALDRELNATA